MNEINHEKEFQQIHAIVHLQNSYKVTKKREDQQKFCQLTQDRTLAMITDISAGCVTDR
jgi:hypothetical protein